MTVVPKSPARDALMRGDMQGVARLATAMIARDPRDPEGPFLLGLAEAAVGRVGAGAARLEAAIALAPRGEYRAQLARLLLMVRRDVEAAAVLAAAEAEPPTDALSRDTMGCAYARLGDHQAALPHFVEAVRLAPERTDFLYNRAATLSFLGRTDAADADLEALIALNPHEGRAHHLLSGLRRQTAEHNHVDRLRTTLARTRNGYDRLLLGYALTKELEDVGRPAEAFVALAGANAEHRRTLPYDFARDAAVFDAIERHWTTPGDGPTEPLLDIVSSKQAPIFVIGMPRTGTTLVDRILSSHPDVESVGELQAMPLAVKAAAGTRTRTVLDVETVQAAARLDPAPIGRDYIARAGPHRQSGRPRLVDKLPGNFQYVGMIARALPGAAIVCLRRHPLDTVLSNFRNLFAVTSRYYDYSYDLAEIAAYYVRFDRLMAAWRRAFPGRVLELGYEALVADQEGQTRALLAHCGLAWDERCMNFQANAAPVSTPSAAQVRRPMNADSIGRWRLHANALDPARRVLEAAGISVS